MSARLVRGLGVLGTVALVVGNMMGTSVYTLPASLARATGPLGILSWVVTAGGYLFIAVAYARLGTRYPRTGGPYVFAREAFGDFSGFQTVWSYWFSCVIGNAAIATGVVGYVAQFVPALDASAGLRFATAQLLIWSLCLLNIRGIRQTARVQITIMFLNVIPLIVVSLLVLGHFEPSNLVPFAPHGYGALAAGAALVVWAYAGVESATVPAEEVRSPEKTIRRGTLVGYGIATVGFLAAALAVAGAMPNEMVASSTRPIALAAEYTLGPLAATLISTTAIIAGVGTLNGWILMSGRVPLSAAEDGIFFRRLAAVHPRYGTPHVALLASTAVASAMLFLLLARDLLDVFAFIVGLSVLTTLIPHVFAMAAEWLLVRRDATQPRGARRRAEAVAAIGFAFVLYTIYGIGAEVVLWGFLVVLAGTPLYIWFTAARRSGAPPPEAGSTAT